ncbi:MAG: ferrous iron transport protein B [Fimbriimonadaceae bacterium]|nr:ferrous iron transport protein B [Fimbriimonadaceae bacterium]
MTVALVGNPNAGKTSVFNALTGSRQKTGNYPGVTVERVTGKMTVEGTEFNVVDVPGLYSVEPVSVDEQMATSVLRGEGPDAPDLLVYVMDATNIERNLFLFSQVVEVEKPTIVALTMTDVLARDQRAVDLIKLSSMLGVPVVPIVPHKGVGVADLREAVYNAVDDPDVPSIDLGFPQVVMDAADGLVETFSRGGVELTRKEARCVILEEHCSTYQRFIEQAELKQAIDDARTAVLGAHARGKTVDAQARYAWASRVRREVVGDLDPNRRGWSDRLDVWLTHRVFGLFIFLAVMYGVFYSIYVAAPPLMDLIQLGVDTVSDLVSKVLAPWPFVQSLVVGGILNGVGAVLVFLPQIAILFLWISILEGTGYLARAAFLMDRLLGWCGLNGRAFIPLLSSFACAVPGIMAARVMPDQRSRLLTSLVAPLMSCSARLPVYTIMIGAVIAPKFGPGWAAFALFAMHFVGMAFAIPTVFVLNKGVFKGRRLPFMLELPRYQRPKGRDIWLTIQSRVKVFVKTAGTIIVVMSVAMWALLEFPRGDKSAYKAEYAQLPAARQQSVSEENYLAERQREDSALGRFGKALEPAFRPAGFDWRLTTAVLAAFPAREVVVPAMSILFGTGDTDNQDTVEKSIARATWPDGKPLVTPWSAVSFMVFFALCCQCMATLATIRRETGSWKWAAFAFTYMTVLAYVVSVAINFVGKAVGGA